MKEVASTAVARTAALRRLADLALHGQLDAYVRTRYEAGRSWRLISFDLLRDTDVDVSHETLRQWYRGEEWAAKGRRA